MNTGRTTIKPRQQLFYGSNFLLWRKRIQPLDHPSKTLVELLTSARLCRTPKSVIVSHRLAAIRAALIVS